MARKSLIKEFNFDIKQDNDKVNDLVNLKNNTDLENIRNKVLERIGSITYTNKIITKEDVLRLINEESLTYNLTNEMRSHLYNVINDEINGYGPLSELLNDNSVSSIMVNGPSDIYIRIDGNIVKDNSVSFINEEHIIRVIKKMLLNTNLKYNETNPMSFKLDNAIVNVALPPLSLDGPIVTIKKYNSLINDIDELIKMGTLTPYMARFLAASIKAGLNIIVCGGTDSGKTNLLSALSNLCDDDKRIIAISNYEKLEINKENVIHLNTRDDIVKQSIKFYPNTLVINNLENVDIYDTLKVMVDNSVNVLSGSEANNLVEVVQELENNLIKEHNLDSDESREYIYNAVDLIVNMSKFDDNRHRVISIAEFNKNSKGSIVLKEIFSYKNDASGAVYTQYNYKPRAYNKIKLKDIDEVDDIFAKLK